ncbi:XRE family transcriptional regulator [Eubacteriales bacterium OttesenSCG-928-K08]|nr:XRE family transcriptional regulator [Eubacteriales bacterium OttesenSCG-928-K08]
MDNHTTPIRIIAAAAKSPDYSPAAVTALMERFNMNERAFALLMNVTPMTVRLWTSGAVVPCGLSRRLMQVYAACPEVIGKITTQEDEPNEQ